MFILDVNDTMLFSSGTTLKCEYAADVAQALSYEFLRMGHAVGLMLLSDQVQYIKPEIGTNYYATIRHALMQKTAYGGAFSLPKAFPVLYSKLKPGSVIFIVSDFFNKDPNMENNLKVLSAQHDVVGICVRDPVEMRLQKGIGQVFISNYNKGESLFIDANRRVIREHYEAEMKADCEKLMHEFRKRGSDVLFLETDKDFVKPVIMFFERLSRWK